MNQDRGYIPHFYEGETVCLPMTGWLGRRALDGTVDIELPPELQVDGATDEERQTRLDALHESLRDVIGRVQVETITRNGQTFEIARINHQEKDKPPKEYLLHGSTYSSSISNPGNLYELALLAMLYPDQPIVYVASYGNGQSSPLSQDERIHFRRTGRMTTTDAEGETHALPTPQNLADALEEHDIHVTRLVGNSAGGNIAIGVGAALPKGQVKQVILQNTPQLGSLSTLAMAARQLSEPSRSKADARTTPDQFVPTKERQLQVVADRPDIYQHVGPKPSFMDRLAMLYSYAAGLRHGVDGTWPHRGVAGLNPLYHDLTALLDQQPEANIDFIVAGQDPLNKRDWRESARIIRDRLHHENPKISLRLVEVPGVTHSFNTHYPQLYFSLIGRLFGWRDTPQSARIHTQN